jgi:hypothetical protein
MNENEPTNWTKERRRTTRRIPREMQRVTFPRTMNLRQRKKYVALHREINFNARFGINEGYTELLRDNAHAMLASHLYASHGF